ncbi:hypothetical protein [Candidatus Steffania adelgidicola]|nr:hypothetical protein [Candidatus Steffania adelgidicola]
MLRKRYLESNIILPDTHIRHSKLVIGRLAAVADLGSFSEDLE